MPVVVTGGAGFIGSHLVERLVREGQQVHVVDDLATGTLENLRAVRRAPNLHVHPLDVTTAPFADLLLQVRPTRIFHLAGNANIPQGLREPRLDLHRTFLTTFHVLEAMKLSGCGSIAFTSSGTVYGEWHGPLGEDHGPLRPISPYAAAKLASEAYVSAAAHLHGWSAHVFRLPNVVGPRLRRGVIHDFVAQVRRDPTRLSILGNGQQTKPYVHVEDVVEAILLGITAPATPLAVFNVAGEGETSVASIAKMVLEAMGAKDAQLHHGEADRGWPGDVPRASFDGSRLRALGWKPRLSSDAAVRAAVAALVQQARR